MKTHRKLLAQNQYTVFKWPISLEIAQFQLCIVIVFCAFISTFLVEYVLGCGKQITKNANIDGFPIVCMRLCHWKMHFKTREEQKSNKEQLKKLMETKSSNRCVFIDEIVTLNTKAAYTRHSKSNWNSTLSLIVELHIGKLLKVSTKEPKSHNRILIFNI